MFTIHTCIRLLVILLFLASTIYRYINAKRAAIEKPKTRQGTLTINFHIFARNCLTFFILIQFLGLNILPFKQNIVIELLGLSLSVVAVTIIYYGRKELGTNWADAAEYQIKQEHKLITSGIYKYVRHPMYIGGALFPVSAELVVGSWLFIPIGVLFIVGGYIQGKKEEKILIEHFGKGYSEYKKNTKMFIPRVI